MKLSIATSIKYGNYRHLKEHAELIIQTVQKILPLLKESIKFKRGIELHIRPIRGNIAGLCYEHTNRIEIDPRFELDYILLTIMHELVHSEQFKQKRFKYKDDVSVFEGVAYKNLSVNDEGYENLPWEREADERAAKLLSVIKYSV